MKLIDTLVSFEDGDSTNPLVIKKTQEIPQEYLDHLADQRKSQASSKLGEFHKFASIPTIVYEKWLKEGFNVMNETPAKIVAKLKQEGLDYFITTDKRV